MNIEPWQEFLQLVQLHIMHGKSPEDACRVAWYQATENAKDSGESMAEQACIRGLKNVIAEDTK